MNTRFCSAAHPRSRGENLSPPPLLCCARLIPAHAGKTSPGRGRPQWCAAHPRSRGENNENGDIPSVGQGSSPLTRGKRPRPGEPPRILRLIPAHAGKTLQVHRARWQPRAHPRSRGENPAPKPGGLGRIGSSPLTRGKPKEELCTALKARLIPAHAGKTAPPPPRGTTRPAHPRSRGENLKNAIESVKTAGSSPLTRGKPLEERRALLSGRLIPAHAGKTPRCLGQRLVPAAHPRSRGENTDLGKRDARHVGSSPLTRGKRVRGLTLVGLNRLIPAHAGKTILLYSAYAPDRAHPRSRGENFAMPRQPWPVTGSSPLTRGKLGIPPAKLAVARLIPAHAGKTPPVA